MPVKVIFWADKLSNQGFKGTCLDIYIYIHKDYLLECNICLWSIQDPFPSLASMLSFTWQHSHTISDATMCKLVKCIDHWLIKEPLTISECNNVQVGQVHWPVADQGPPNQVSKGQADDYPHQVWHAHICYQHAFKVCLHTSTPNPLPSFLPNIISSRHMSPVRGIAFPDYHIHTLLYRETHMQIHTCICTCTQAHTLHLYAQIQIASRGAQRKTCGASNSHLKQSWTTFPRVVLAIEEGTPIHDRTSGGIKLCST